MYLGDFNAGDIIDFKFCTVGNTGAPTVLAGTPALSVYKANGTTESTTGITLSVDFDGRVGMNHVRIDTADAFYANGNDFQVIITAGTVGGTSVVGYVVGHFSLRNRGVTLRGITHTGAVVPTVTTLTGHTPQTGDTYARVGAPVGASISDDIAGNKTVGDNIYSRLGAPAGASVSADVAANKTVVDAIKVRTDLTPEGIKKNTARANFTFVMTDSTTNQAKTGLVNGDFTKKYRLDNGSPGDLSGTITEVSSASFPGLYSIDLTSGELNGDMVVFRFAASGANDLEITIKTSA